MLGTDLGSLARILVGRGVFIEWQEREQLKAAWGAWLTDQQWDAFITVTFRVPRMAAHAISTLNGVQKVIERSAPWEAGFLGTEEHLSRQLHVHGLLRAETERPPLSLRIMRTLTWRALLSGFGRSQVQTPDSIGGVSAYVTKYVVKSLGEYAVW